jgi:hypothetical protein
MADKKIAVCVVLLVIIMMACSTAPSASPPPDAYTVGMVTVRSNGEEYEPARLMLHGASTDSSGQQIGVSGVPFEWWLEGRIDEIPVIQYTGHLQVTVDGRDGRIIGHGRPAPAYHDGMKIIGLRAAEFAAGTAEVLLPDEPGDYIVFFDVFWSAGGFEFIEVRYIFIVSIVGAPTSIPLATPSPSPNSKGSPIKDDAYYERLIEGVAYDVIGKWVLCYAKDKETNEDYSLQLLYGTGIKFGGFLSLNDDKTFSLYIGITDDDVDSHEGVFTVEGSSIALEYNNGVVMNAKFITLTDEIRVETTGMSGNTVFMFFGRSSAN